MSTKISVIIGDITKIKADAIVNAANESLLGGSGVDGAIHDAAGRELYNECKKLGGCKTGSAKITKAYKLPAKYIIHAVGPRYKDGKHGEAELLASCYKESLELAVKHKCRTIAFPSISTGVFSYPLDEAANIAITNVMKFADEHDEIEEIIFVCFSDKTKQAYEQALDMLNNANRVDNMQQSSSFQGSLIHNAIEFATVKHNGQLRKGSKVPYIVHPFETSHILTQEGCNDEVIVAGLLHDLVEDTEVSIIDIESNFGKRVAELVSSCSEDKSKTWRERKQHTIDFLSACEDIDVILLSCADKLANMRSIVADYESLGEGLWKRFKRGKTEQGWYYSRLIDVFGEKIRDHNMFWEISRLFNKVFVDYYTNASNNTLIQMFQDEKYIMKQNEPIWRPYESAIPKTYKKLTYEQAIAFEKQWTGEKVIVKYTEFKYPYPCLKTDRGQRTLGFCQGMFSDGRPYYASLWTQEQITMITIYMVANGFKAYEKYEEEVGLDIECVDEIMNYLKDQGVFYLSKKSVQIDIYRDQNNHKILSCNIVVGDEDKTYGEFSFEFVDMKAFE